MARRVLVSSIRAARRGAFARRCLSDDSPLSPTPAPAEFPDAIAADASRGQNNHVHVTTYWGMATGAFDKQVSSILMAPVNPEDVEIKPDGQIYLPEIKYRRILNQAFGPGGWALAPKGEIRHFQSETDGSNLMTREYALYCLGRFVSQAVGEHSYYSKNNLAYGKACESSRSSALVRCCKDLGIASELWDPQFISKWKEENAVDVWCENIRSREKKKLWRHKNQSDSVFPFPWKANR